MRLLLHVNRFHVPFETGCTRQDAAAESAQYAAVFKRREAATTSARRWLANGVWRTTFTNWRALWMRKRGCSPEAIRAFYDRKLAAGKLAADK